MYYTANKSFIIVRYCENGDQKAYFEFDLKNFQKMECHYKNDEGKWINGEGPLAGLSASDLTPQIKTKTAIEVNK